MTAASTSVRTPIDDLPPVTVITHVRKAKDKIIVRGVTVDNGTVKQVVVNGQQAVALAPNFAEREAVLDNDNQGPLALTAHAIDAVGNVEKMPHRMEAFGKEN